MIFQKSIEDGKCEGGGRDPQEGNCFKKSFLSIFSKTKACLFPHQASESPGPCRTETQAPLPVRSSPFWYIQCRSTPPRPLSPLFPRNFRKKGFLKKLSGIRYKLWRAEEAAPSPRRRGRSTPPVSRRETMGTVQNIRGFFFLLQKMQHCPLD